MRFPVNKDLSAAARPLGDVSLCCVHFGIFCIYILHFFFFPRRARPGQIYQKYQIGQPHMSARGQEAKKIQSDSLGVDGSG